ncbi:unnamed protein product [Darwinula stevensoni]|uniref:Uncharacterized protein n=1 Tax=Darwinula stevensoni TaxID=69355 RepID=A0A7R8XDQ6_9CRUS|nr:unnamed protein product [Darwinula stevensoni]CAG0893504.1 unnamed protein product [Darwinula stevensoni]
MPTDKKDLDETPVYLSASQVLHKMEEFCHSRSRSCEKDSDPNAERDAVPLPYPAENFHDSNHWHTEKVTNMPAQSMVEAEHGHKTSGESLRKNSGRKKSSPISTPGGSSQGTGHIGYVAMPLMQSGVLPVLPSGGNALFVFSGSTKPVISGVPVSLASGLNIIGLHENLLKDGEEMREPKVKQAKRKKQASKGVLGHKKTSNAAPQSLVVHHDSVHKTPSICSMIAETQRNPCDQQSTTSCSTSSPVPTMLSPCKVTSIEVSCDKNGECYERLWPAPKDKLPLKQLDGSSPGNGVLQTDNNIHMMTTASPSQESCLNVQRKFRKCLEHRRTKKSAKMVKVHHTYLNVSQKKLPREDPIEVESYCHEVRQLHDLHMALRLSYCDLYPLGLLSSDDDEDSNCDIVVGHQQHWFSVDRKGSSGAAFSTCQVSCDLPYLPLEHVALPSEHLQQLDRGEEMRLVLRDLKAQVVQRTRGLKLASKCVSRRYVRQLMAAARASPWQTAEFVRKLAQKGKLASRNPQKRARGTPLLKRHKRRKKKPKILQEDEKGQRNPGYIRPMSPPMMPSPESESCQIYDSTPDIEEMAVLDFPHLCESVSAQLLEEPYLREVLNKLPEDAFTDIFSSVLPATTSSHSSHVHDRCKKMLNLNLSHKVQKRKVARRGRKPKREVILPPPRPPPVVMHLPLDVEGRMVQYLQVLTPQGTTSTPSAMVLSSPVPYCQMKNGLIASSSQPMLSCAPSESSPNAMMVQTQMQALP